MDAAISQHQELVAALEAEGATCHFLEPGGFPMTGFSLQWYAKLMANEQVLAAFRTSLWIALVTAAQGSWVRR
ncbi:hypothetical protein NKH48_34730 [Mesorhizobium sp. M1233]|uniref:hypothetical protein n=1 Tax=Mesorhizobium sp. M1233 TaxID=2957072 RepID=UPI0033394F3E